jgi:hypothetical protein
MKRLLLAAMLLGASTDTPGGSIGYAIDNWSVDNGGGRSSGGIYVLESSIGQPDADPAQPSTAQGYALVGGFLAAAADAPPSDALFGNGFESP